MTHPKNNIEVYMYYYNTLLNRKKIITILFLLTYSFHSASQTNSNIFSSTFVSIQPLTNPFVTTADFDNTGIIKLYVSGKLGSNEYKHYFYSYIGTGYSIYPVETSKLCYKYGSNGSSNFGDYDNDGDLDLLISGIAQAGTDGNCGSDPNSTYNVTKLLRYSGGEFTPVIDFYGIRDGVAVFGDYNNDGYADVLVSGSGVSKLYRNNNGGAFLEVTSSTFVGVSGAESNFSDYDNDGDLDIFILGTYSKLYTNNGGTSFAEVSGVSFPGYTAGHASVADYDADGYPDVFITGYSGSIFSSLYKNNRGTGFSTVYNGTFFPVYYSHTHLSDYDNDGDLDVFLSGRTSLTDTTKVSYLYKNNRTSFSQWHSFRGTEAGANSPVDYDNDGDLDILIIDKNFGRIFTNNIIVNKSALTNTPPTAPSSLTFSISSQSVTFVWNRSSDDKTPTSALGYNVFMGTNTETEKYRVSETHIKNVYSSRRKVAKTGTIKDTFLFVGKLIPGIYYCGVQAIDNSYASSSWKYNTLKIAPTLYPATNITTNGFTFQWEKSLYPAYYYDISLDNTFTTLVNSNTFVSGTVATITNARPGSTYYIRVRNNNSIEYTDYSNVIEVEIPSKFTEMTGAGYTFRARARGTNAFVDVDNDNDLDLLANDVTGVIYFYKNTSTGFNTSNFFISENPLLTRVLGDYNNDGYVDLFVTSWNSSNSRGRSRLYRNNLGTSFTEMTSTGFSFTDVHQGSSVFMDYDGDGYVDIAYSGSSGSTITSSNQGITKLYKNNQGTGFTEIQTFSGFFIAGVSDAADIDNDGYMDIMFAGLGSGGKIYKNNNGRFDVLNSLSFSNVPDATYGVSSQHFLGDVDNDDDIDILYTGTDGVSLYKNNNMVFTQSYPLGNLRSFSTNFADINGDGKLDIITVADTNNTSTPSSIKNKIYWYKNTEKGFVKYSINTAPLNLIFPYTSFGDYDGDGDIDVFVSGYTKTTVINYVAKLYRNENINSNGTIVANTKPNPPTNLTSVRIDNDKIKFVWNAASDAQQNPLSLSYNIYVGYGVNLEKINPSQSFISGSLEGKQKIVNFGKIRNTYHTLTLSPGIYFWGVQAIDNNFAGSLFADAPNFFSIPQKNYLTTNDSGIYIAYWDRVKGATSYRIEISNNKNFHTLAYVSSLTDTSLRISSFLPETRDYYYRVNATNGIHTTIYSDTVTIGSERFSKAFTFPGYIRSTNSFGDYDNDGDLDFFLAGGDGYDIRNKSALYKNQNGTFIEQTGAAFSFGKIFDGVSNFVDYDNDGDLDIQVSNEYFGPISTYTAYYDVLYKNNGTGFERRKFNTVGCNPLYYDGKRNIFLDYDRDGYIDYFENGFQLAPCVGVGAIYGYPLLHKNTNGNFIQMDGNLFTGNIYFYMEYPSNTFFDYDNNGKVDILFTGYKRDYSKLQFYAYTYAPTTQNFISQTHSFIPMAYGTMSVGDYNNDGYEDVFAAGATSLTKTLYYPQSSYLYTNRGDGTLNFSLDNKGGNFSAPLKDTYGDSDFGDYDNDGDLDLLVAGTMEGNIVYRNDSNIFIKVISLSGRETSSGAFFDYDNDGDLDIILSGSSATSIYRNELGTNIFSQNTRPIPPTGLVASVLQNNNVRFQWNKATDAQTSTDALNYNIYCGTRFSQEVVITSHSNISSDSTIDGKRKIVQRGRIQNNEFTLRDSLSHGIYYWSVQAIDQAFEGSPWTSQYFIIPPKIVSHGLIGGGGFLPYVTFTPMNGFPKITNTREHPYYTLEIADDSTFQNIYPTDGINTYNCCYSDDIYTNPGVTNTNRIAVYRRQEFLPGKKYYARIKAFDSLRTAYTQYVVFQRPIGLDDIQTTLRATAWGSSIFGDYDNDGDLDCFITGSIGGNTGIANLYKNDRGIFTQLTSSAYTFNEVISSSSNFVDYDNDGDLDIFVSGQSSVYARSSFMYRNEGTGFGKSFSGIRGSSQLPRVFRSSSDFGDYNHDGFLDLLISGRDENSILKTSLYKNNSGTGFQLVNYSFVGIEWGSNNFIDYDNDGDLDIFISGKNVSGIGVTKLYKNDSTKFFEVTQFSFAQLYNSSVSFGDYDNDSDIDIFLSGTNETTSYSYLYKNNITSFTAIHNFTGVSLSASEMEDFDGDGDIDILLSGISGSDISTELYLNEKGIFTSKTIFDNGKTLYGSSISQDTLLPTYQGSNNFVDYDNDGDMDILINGSKTVSFPTHIIDNATLALKFYRNQKRNIVDTNTYSSNKIPTTPTALVSSAINTEKVILSWRPSTDSTINGASENTIYYDLTIGTKENKISVKSPASLSSGKRLTGETGNIITPFFVLNTSSLPKLKVYYWKVQAIDGAKSGSNWSQEDSFIVKENQFLYLAEIGHKQYSDMFQLTTSSNSSLPITYTFDTSYIRLTNGTLSIKQVGVGSTTISIMKQGNNYYYPSTIITKTISIFKKEQTIDFSQPFLREYGDIIDLVPTSSSGLPITYFTSSPSKAFINQNRIIINSPGTVTITAIQAGNANYLPITLSRVLTINKRRQIISFEPFQNSKIYGDDPFQLPISSNSPLPITYTLTPSGIIFIYNNVVNILSAGTVSIMAIQEGTNNYLKADSVVRQLIVNKATQTIYFSNATIFKTVGDPTFSLNYITSSGLPITYSLSNTHACTVSQNIFTIQESGIATIHINQLGNPNYFPTYGYQNIIVIDPGKEFQNINFSSIPEKTFGDSPFTLLASTNSGLSVSYYSENTSIISIQRDTVTILQAGEATIYSIQTGDINYNPEFVSQTIRIQKATPPVYFEEIPIKTFGTSPFILSAYSYPGLAIFYASSLTNILEIRRDTAIMKNTGIVSVSAFQTGSTNYNPSQTMRLVKIDNPSKNSQTITFFSIPTKIYGDNPFSLQANNTASLGITYISFNTSIATISSNIVTIRGTGTCLIAAYNIGNNTYNPSNIAYQVLNVQKANQTILLNPITERLDNEPPFTISATTTSGLPISYSIANTEIASIVGNTITIHTPGVTALTAFQIGNSFYNPQSTNQSIVINSISRQTQTITFSAISEKIIGDPPFKLFATTTSTLPITFISTNTSVASIRNDSVTIHTHGQVTITAYQYGNVYFNATSQNQILVIKLPQTITFQNITPKTFGSPSFEINASSTSLLPISYSFSNPSIAHITNNVITILGAGTTLVIASQPGNNTYKTAQNISQILTIEKATQTITFDDIPSKYVGDELFEIFATTTSNLPITFIPSNLEAIQVTGENYISIIKGGTITITATQNGNNNYHPANPVSQPIIISKRNQIIVFSQIQNKKYLEEPSFTIHAYATSTLPIRFTSSEESVAAIDEQLVILKQPGTTTITAYQEGNNEYDPAPTVSRTLVINKATQIIGFSTIPLKTTTESSFILTATINSHLPIRYSSSIPNVASLFDDVVFIKEIGTTTITAYQEGNSLYNPASPIQQILSIIPEPQPEPQSEGIEQHITFPPIPPKDTKSPSFVLFASASSGLRISYKSSNTKIIRIHPNSDSVTIYQSGQVTITAYQLGNRKYKFAPPVSRHLIIIDPEKKQQNISFEPIPPKTLGGNPFMILANASSSLPVTFLSSDTLKIIIHKDTAHIMNGGIAYITAIQTGNDEYNPAIPIEQKISIVDPSKKNQTIIFDAIPPKNTKSPNFLLNATATSGYSLSYQITNTNIADISLRNVIIKQAGTTFITAYQEGDEEFNPAEPVSQILTVTDPDDTTIVHIKKNQYITFPIPDIVTQGVDKFFILKASASSGLNITYITLDTSFIKITNDIVTPQNISITTPQTITITALQSGDNIYNPAPAVNRLLLMKPNPLTPTQNNTNNHIKIYPNPTKDIINIEIDKNINPHKYQLIDINGNIIIEALFQTQNKLIHKIYLKKIKPGEYILIITDRNKILIATQKIIIYE
ncbi:MAG: FG-GAP-like repeat-containing protein [Chitinophagaceae bacterium]|nr:FG-GAP-like repeat-containing protein [Chitinophagaceae bacterium]